VLLRNTAFFGILRAMSTNVQVEKNSGESTANLIRRFTKRVQGAGIVPRVRGSRYHERVKSRNIHKTKRLKRLKKRAVYDELLKLGKIAERAPRK
jgi:ribosomal protein S21